MIFVFSAPSGSGKSTLINHLMSRVGGLSFSVSATSRAPRGEERDGVEYHFLTREEFEQKIKEDAFIEYEEVYAGTYYGTLRSEIDSRLQRGENVVLDIDVKGGINVKRIYGEQALLIFVQPPSIEELRHRLEARRTDSADKIEQRVAKAEYELTFASQFDTVIVNDDLEAAKREVVDIVQSHMAKPCRRRVGILGGSYNPIHNGHIAIAKGVLQSGMVDEVWLMVSPRNPLKQERELMGDEERLTRVQNAVKDLKDIKACDIEFGLEKPSYTYLTMRHLHEVYPDYEFALIIGADNWERFPMWRNHEELAEKYRLIIYPRKGSDIDRSALPPNAQLLDLPLLDISSTEIRERMAHGEDIDSLIPEP